MISILLHHTSTKDAEATTREGVTAGVVRGVRPGSSRASKSPPGGKGRKRSFGGNSADAKAWRPERDARSGRDKDKFKTS